MDYRSACDLGSPTSLVTLDGAEDRLPIGGDLSLEGAVLAVDLDGRRVYGPQRLVEP